MKGEIGDWVLPIDIELSICCSLIVEISWRFGEKSTTIWRNTWRNMLVLRRKHARRFGKKVFGDLERKCSAIWRNLFGENVGDLEKFGRRFGETYSAKSWSAIWRTCSAKSWSAISYWSSLWSSMELGDHKWRLNHNGEKVETIYGDQNFVHHKVESTYLGCFKDRNV